MIYFMGYLVLSVTITYMITLFFKVNIVVRRVSPMIISIGGAWLIVDHLATDAMDYFWFFAALVTMPVVIVFIETAVWLVERWQKRRGGNEPEGSREQNS